MHLANTVIFEIVCFLTNFHQKWVKSLWSSKLRLTNLRRILIQTQSGRFWLFQEIEVEDVGQEQSHWNQPAGGPKDLEVHREQAEYRRSWYTEGIKVGMHRTRWRVDQRLWVDAWKRSRLSSEDHRASHSGQWSAFGSSKRAIHSGVPEWQLLHWPSFYACTEGSRRSWIKIPILWLRYRSKQIPFSESCENIRISIKICEKYAHCSEKRAKVLEIYQTF